MRLPSDVADEYLRLYRSFVAAREIDRLESEFVRRGEAFFHIAGAGHETSAALASHLIAADYVHCHYRDKALLIHRGLPLRQFFDSLFCTESSHSRGRQMSVFLCDRALNVLSTVGPVGNNALHAVGVAAEIHRQVERPIVVCSAGDGATQEGEFFEAIAEAVRESLPVLFLIHDNGWSISTPTRGRSFFSRPNGDASEFYGVPVTHIDGRCPLVAHEQFGSVVRGMRESRGPAIVRLDVDRLCDHSNADDQSTYRNVAELQAATEADPLRMLVDGLLSLGADSALLSSIEADAHHEVAKAADLAAGAPDPRPVFTAKASLPEDSLAMQISCTNVGATRWEDNTQQTMREAICETLRRRLHADPRVFLFGQDIEDPKGDVFGVTRGLSTAFPGRVRNAPLAEATIVGTSIGRALAGARPVAFLQFADFLPLAYNQILCELGSIYWRTDGAWQAPVIVMIACGGYRPGLGPFHSQTLESIGAHTPGIDVVMPSTAADAAGLLNAAFASGRPTLFFYPKACLNEPGATPALPAGIAPAPASACGLGVAPTFPVGQSTPTPYIPLGKAKLVKRGDDLTFVSWGSTLMHCCRAAESLAGAGTRAEVIDLRSLSPWDEYAVLESVRRTKRLVVVHEDNHTCGFGAEVMATVLEKSGVPVAARRVARPDTFAPCHFGNQLEVLPSHRRVLSAACDLLGIDVVWKDEPCDETGIYCIDAIGSGPADESVIVIDILVRRGEIIAVGEPIANIEASKAVFTISSTVSGIVEQIAVRAGETVNVGAPLVRVRTHDARRKPLTRERVGTPLFGPALAFSRGAAPRRIASRNSAGQADAMRRGMRAYVTRPACELGSKLVSTAELAASIAGWNAAEAIRRTGIAHRHTASNGESVVSLAVHAARKLLISLGKRFPPISALICSTTSPQEATPSVACQVSTELWRAMPRTESFRAFDVNAACSGFLFALNLAIRQLQTEHGGAVLLVTSEVLSPLIKPNDPTTAFLFGDAATATLVTRVPITAASLQVAIPLLRSAPDGDQTLWSPNCGAGGYLKMDGIRVARAANKAMSDVLVSALAEVDLTPKDLAAVIPHPGSHRIVESVAYRLGIDSVRLLHTLTETGNTSSSSIPLAIDQRWDDIPCDELLGMTAFGAGYTFAACLAMKCARAAEGSAARPAHTYEGLAAANHGARETTTCTVGGRGLISLEIQR